ncbi:hypothetical protein TNCV_3090831 [Trichonephila clavipes]|uniref:Transposase n=1 Tax=Trichonephila clavipes TaxID=2585209 RepID=A0A8X6W8N8_TRICX|nr:hypothetical protein TNCV_3090831 [Trichonephila clavipes]
MVTSFPVQFGQGSVPGNQHQTASTTAGDVAINESTYHRWFCKCTEGDRGCQDQARSEWPSHVGEGDTDQSIRNILNPAMQELADTFNVHWETVKRQLVNLGFRRKLHRWVSHNLTAKQGDDRIRNCFLAFPGQE